MTITKDGDVIEKSALASKKFIALKIGSVLWTLIISATLAAMVWAEGMQAVLGTVLLAEVLCLGFIQAVYIGGQAAVDAFVRMAALITGRKVTQKAATTPDPTLIPDVDPTP